MGEGMKNMQMVMYILVNSILERLMDKENIHGKTLVSSIKESGIEGIDMDMAFGKVKMEKIIM